MIGRKLHTPLCFRFDKKVWQWWRATYSVSIIECQASFEIVIPLCFFEQWWPLLSDMCSGCNIRQRFHTDSLHTLYCTSCHSILLVQSTKQQYNVYFSQKVQSCTCIQYCRSRLSVVQLKTEIDQVQSFVNRQYPERSPDISTEASASIPEIGGGSSL